MWLRTSEGGREERRQRDELLKRLGKGGRRERTYEKERQ